MIQHRACSQGGMGFFVSTLTNFTNQESRVTIHGDRGTSEQLEGEGGWNF